MWWCGRTMQQREGQSDMTGEQLTSREQGRGLYQRLGPRVTRMWGVMGLLALRS